MLPGPAVHGCCLVSFRFLSDIQSIQYVQTLFQHFRRIVRVRFSFVSELMLSKLGYAFEEPPNWVTLPRFKVKVAGRGRIHNGILEIRVAGPRGKQR